LELQKHYEEEYPEIDMDSAKIGLLEKNGYSPIPSSFIFHDPHCQDVPEPS
jgi:hypothetical protein